MLTNSPNSSHEVCQDGEGPDTETAESGSGGDVSVELVDHGCLSVASHNHLEYKM